MNETLITEFPVQNNDGSRYMWLGIKVGPFAVCEGDTGWTIIHHSSGWAVIKDAVSVLHAIAIAEAIAPLLDWTLTAAEIKASEEKYKIRAVILATRCPYDLKAEAA